MNWDMVQGSSGPSIQLKYRLRLLYTKNKRHPKGVFYF